MDDIQKSTIRLAHWIDHNRDHVKGYQEVMESLEREGLEGAAGMVRGSIELIEQANGKLEQALALLAGPEHGAGDLHAAAHHKHSHRHSHDGPSDHGHGHVHDDSHGHDHKIRK